MKLQKYQTIHSDDELTFEPDDDGDVYMAADVDARIVELENLLQCFCDRSFSNNGNRCIQCGRWPGHGEVHADDCPVGKALSLMET